MIGFIIGAVLGGTFGVAVMCLLVANKCKEDPRGLIPLYVCDRKNCGEKCPNPDCKYTLDIEHAVNFTNDGQGGPYYIEKEDK